MPIEIYEVIDYFSRGPETARKTRQNLQTHPLSHMNCYTSRRKVIPYQSSFSGTLDSVQANEEWRCILAGSVVCFLVEFDSVCYKGYAVLRLVVDYLRHAGDRLANLKMTDHEAYKKSGGPH